MPTEILCPCQVEGIPVRRFGKIRKSRISFDSGKLSVKRGKRIKIVKSQEK